MLWFGLRKALDDVEERLSTLERGIEERIAGLTNAADLYNRASARAERSKIKTREGNGDLDDEGLMAIRRRRGGF